MNETSDSETTEKKDDDARKETNLPEGNTEAESLDNPETDEVDASPTDSSDLETPVKTQDAASEEIDDAEGDAEVEVDDTEGDAEVEVDDTEGDAEVEVDDAEGDAEVEVDDTEGDAEVEVDDAEGDAEVEVEDNLEADASPTDSSDLETSEETQDTVLEGIDDAEVDAEAEDNLEEASMDEVEEDSADSSNLETISKIKGSVTDEATDADDKPDKGDLSESHDSSQISEILEGLVSVSEKVDKLSNPTSQQLNQAKSLILALAGITGMVMIAAITFFIVMSVSISQKVDELDRVLMAVAKRGIQLGDGIETIAEMDSKLIEVIDQNNPIPSTLSNIEAQLFTHGRTIIEKDENINTTVKTQSNTILTGQDGIKKELAAEFERLKKLINQSVDFDPLMKEHLELKNQVESLNKIVTNVESKVQELYVIKQAEMEIAYKQLTSGD